MNNGNESIGITVVNTNPEAHQFDIATDSVIQITFSADLNRSTLNNCILVFEDYQKIYNGTSSLRNTSQFNIVKGSVSYANRILTFTPNKPLNIDTKYIVVINNNIKDITGAPLIKKHIFAFNTELTKTFGKCELINPKYGLICSEIPEIQWKDNGAPSYILQVSKSNQFESLLCETFVVSMEDNSFTQKDEFEMQPEEIYPDEVPPEEQPYVVITHTPDFIKKEGVYYIRIKPEGGKWSDVLQFFIKEVTDAVIAKDDQDDTLYLDEFLDGIEEEIEILEFFPPDESVNNSLKTNIFYIKMKGEVDESRINISDFEVIGEPFDEEDDEKYAHGIVNGSWTLVYDESQDCTYLIFTPVIPEDEEDIKLLATIHGANIESDSSES